MLSHYVWQTEVIGYPREKKNGMARLSRIARSDFNAVGFFFFKCCGLVYWPHPHITRNYNMSVIVRENMFKPWGSITVVAQQPPVQAALWLFGIFCTYKNEKGTTSLWLQACGAVCSHRAALSPL